ncbi:MAG TPA: hypothetical protein ENF95_01175 [Candidatus Aenigmarchaeota archaeon]|nr:hypothetical protein [Candidatus Aenigmarchaeota archaeon]
MSKKIGRSPENELIDKLNQMKFEKVFLIFETCKSCGFPLYLADYTEEEDIYKCVKCGRIKAVPYDTTEVHAYFC